jgi:tape measure domain-containing protein
MSLGKLSIDLEARIAKFESDMGRAARILQRDLVNGQKAAERANNQMRQTMERNAQRIEQSARSAATVIGSVFAAQQIVQYAAALSRVADGYSNIQAKVKLAAGENANLAGRLDEVYGVAIRTFSSLDATAGVVQKASLGLQSLGHSADTAFSDAIFLAETFNKGLLVSGANTAQAVAATEQFGQAIASNKFSGDEFRTMMELNSAFAQALAKSLGVTTAELRDMSKEGKITTQTLLEMKGKVKDLDDQAAGIPLTIGRAKQNLDATFTKFIGQADQANGTSRAVADGIAAIGNNIGPVVQSLGQLAIIAGGAFAARSLQSLRSYAAAMLENAAAARVAQAAEQQRAAGDAAAAQQALLRARGEQVAAQATAAAAAADRQRIQATIAMATAQEAMIRANALRATSEIELARLSQQLTATEGARIAATEALGAARQAEIRANAQLLASNRALQAGYVATGNAGASAAAKITIGMRAASLAQNAMTLATRGFSAALALVGGPLGVVIIGVGLLASAFANARAQADAAESSFKNAIQASQSFQDNQSRASFLQAGAQLLSDKSSIQQQLEEQRRVKELRARGMNNPFITGGTQTRDVLNEAIRVNEVRLVEINKQLELNRQKMEMNRAEWDKTTASVGANTGKYADQHNALDKEIQQLTARRLEITKGVRASLEYEAMQAQGVKTAAELDAGTKARIDTLVKERAAIDGAKESRRAGVRAGKEAEAQEKRSESAAYQYSNALSQLSESMGTDLHAAMEQYSQDVAKFGEIAKKGKVSADDLTRAKELLDARLAQTTDVIRADIQGPQAQATLEYERALARTREQASLLKMSEDDLAAAEKRLATEFAATTKEIERRSDPAGALISDLEFELSLLGMGNAARQTAIQLREMEGRATEEQAEKLKKLNAEYEQQSKNIRFMDTLRGSAVDAGMEIAKNFGNAGDAIRGFFDSLQEQIMRRILEGWIDQLLGPQGSTGQGTSGGGKLWDLIGGFFGKGTGSATPSGSQGETSSGGSWWNTAVSIVSGMFGGGRANGGHAASNTIYEINENIRTEGPEMLSVGGRQFLMMGGQSGTVTPGNGSGAGFTQVINNNYAAPTEPRTQSQVAEKQGFITQRAIQRSRG